MCMCMCMCMYVYVYVYVYVYMYMHVYVYIYIYNIHYKFVSCGKQSLSHSSGDYRLVLVARKLDNQTREPDAIIT